MEDEYTIPWGQRASDIAVARWNQLKFNIGEQRLPAWTKYQIVVMLIYKNVSGCFIMHKMACISWHSLWNSEEGGFILTWMW